jgi:hypothetical protein
MKTGLSLSAGLVILCGCVASPSAQFVEHTSVGLSFGAGESPSTPADLSLGMKRRVLARVPQRGPGSRAGQIGDLLVSVELEPDPTDSAKDALRLDARLFSGRAARIALLPEEQRTALWREGLRLSAAGSQACTAPAATRDN